MVALARVQKPTSRNVILYLQIEVVLPFVPNGKDSQPPKWKGLKNAVLQDDAALQVSKFFENLLGACMYFAQKKGFHPQLPCNLQNRGYSQPPPSPLWDLVP